MTTERICPRCGRIHTRARHNTCYRCYNRIKRGIPLDAPDQRRLSRLQAPRRRTDLLCAPGLCDQPATEYRHITIGGAGIGPGRSAILWLCPACAALHDAEEQRTIAHLIPPRRSHTGGSYHC